MTKITSNLDDDYKSISKKILSQDSISEKISVFFMFTLTHSHNTMELVKIHLKENHYEIYIELKPHFKELKKQKIKSRVDEVGWWGFYGENIKAGIFVIIFFIVILYSFLYL